MSIRDESKARQRQQDQRAARRSKEAEARPDTLHRAVVFLLRAATENNPDITEEAKHHITSLDAELANLEKVAEIEKPAAAAKTAVDSEDEAEAPKAPDTAKAIRQSKRFQRG